MSKKWFVARESRFCFIIIISELFRARKRSSSLAPPPPADILLVAKDPSKFLLWPPRMVDLLRFTPKLFAISAILAELNRLEGLIIVGDSFR